MDIFGSECELSLFGIWMYVVLYKHDVLTHDKCEVGSTLCPPIGLCYFLSFNLSILSHFKPFFTTPSFLPFSSHSGPLPHAGVLSLLVHPCKTAHANTVTHTPLRLYLIIGSITGDIFPDNGIEGSEPEWRGRSLYPASHGSHSAGTPSDWDEWI